MIKINIIFSIICIHLFSLTMLLFKYPNNTITYSWVTINTIFNFWFYYKLRQYDDLDKTKELYNKTDKVKGQWE